MAGKDCRVLIIGCGISGVAAAQRLSEAGFHQVRILEATGRSGGRLQTEMMGEPVRTPLINNFIARDLRENPCTYARNER